MKMSGLSTTSESCRPPKRCRLNDSPKTQVLESIRTKATTLADHPEYQDDYEVVLEAVQVDPDKSFEFASSKLQKNRNIALMALQGSWLGWEETRKIVRNFSSDREIVLEATRGVAIHFINVDAGLQNDPKFVLEAVQNNGDILRYLDPHFRRNREIVLTAVSNWPAALQYADPELQADHGIVMTAVQQDGYTLQYAARSLWKTHDIVLAAVQNDGLMLGYAGSDLRANDAVVMAAVRKNGCALQYADSKLQDNKTIVAAAVEQDGDALQYASRGLRNDPKLFARASQNGLYSCRQDPFFSEVYEATKNILAELVQHGMLERGAMSVPWRQLASSLRHRYMESRFLVICASRTKKQAETARASCAARINRESLRLVFGFVGRQDLDLAAKLESYGDVMDALSVSSDLNPLLKECFASPVCMCVCCQWIE